MTRHRIEVAAAFVAGMMLALAIAGPVQAGLSNCRPARKCNTATPRPSVTASPRPTPTPTMRATPAATAAPTPASTASTRPFAAPVTSSTATVPASVSSGSAFNAWLGSVPNGTTITFSAGASLNLDTGLHITGRSNLVLELNGATLRVQGPGNTPDSSPFALRASSHIAIAGPATVVGNDPNTTTVFVSGSENSHVLALSGWGGQGPSSYVEISGISASHVYGDFAYLEGRNVAPYEPSSFVWIHDNAASYIGRNAVSSIDVTDVLIERNSFDRVGMDAWDIEPNFDGQVVKRNTYRDNQVGAYSLMTQFDGWLLSTWNLTAAAIEDIVLEQNDVVGVASKGHGGGPRGLHVQVDHSGRPHRVTVIGNRTGQAAPGPVMRFVNADGVTVQSNVQPLTSGALASFSGCTGVTYP